jgi:hypothetical protein
MNLTLGMSAFAVLLPLAMCGAPTLNAQRSNVNATCAHPVSLELVPGENGETDYKLSGKLYVGYPLDALRNALSEWPGIAALICLCGQPHS